MCMCRRYVLLFEFCFNQRVPDVLEMLCFVVLAWVAGNEVIVKNVNATIPVSLSWLLLPFLAFLCFPASAQFIASSS